MSKLKWIHIYAKLNPDWPYGVEYMPVVRETPFPESRESDIWFVRSYRDK